MNLTTPGSISSPLKRERKLRLDVESRMKHRGIGTFCEGYRRRSLNVSRLHTTLRDVPRLHNGKLVGCLGGFHKRSHTFRQQIMFYSTNRTETEAFSPRSLVVAPWRATTGGSASGRSIGLVPLALRLPCRRYMHVIHNAISSNSDLAIEVMGRIRCDDPEERITSRV